MLKALLVSSAVVGTAVLASPAAKADGFYINPEYNGSFDNDLEYGGGVIEGHVGYEKGNFYIQWGPAALVPNGGEAAGGFSAKTGYSASLSEEFSLYGEVSTAKFEDMDLSFGAKIGAKYKF